MDLVRFYTNSTQISGVVIISSIISSGSNCHSGQPEDGFVQEWHADEMDWWSNGRHLLHRKQRIFCVQKVGKSYFEKSQKTKKSVRIMICWFIALFYRNLFDVLHHSPECCRSLGQWQTRCSRLDQWAVSWPSQQTGLSGLVVSGCDAFQIKSVFRGCWWSDLHMELIQYQQQSTDINNCACGLWLIPILTKSFW